MNLRLQALDVGLRLRVEDDVLADRLRAALGELVTPGSSASGDHEVTVHGRGPWTVVAATGTATADTSEQALTRTLTAVNQTAVTETRLLAFHAAVVTRHGSALVVPARSGAGKSTLTACLLRQGWSYVSDEALAVDWQSGRLAAYPRPMALSPWSCAAVGGVTGLAGEGETVVRSCDLEATVDRQPGPVGHVLLLRRGTSSAPALTAVDRNEGLHELLQRGFTHHRDGGTALRRTAELLSSSTVLALTLGDPVQAAAALTARIDAA